MIYEEEPVVVSDVPDYADKQVTFDDFKTMFMQNRQELDDAVCKIEKNTDFTTVSSFFDSFGTEKSMVDKDISIEWLVVKNTYI